MKRKIKRKKIIKKSNLRDLFYLYIKKNIFFFICGFLIDTIPIKGTASDVVGIDSATRFKNTVNDRRIVTPGIF